MSTFTPPIDWVGPTPWGDIAKAYDEQTPEGYPMQLVGEDAEAATAAINQGIDARLEAVTSIGEMAWKNTHPKFGFPKLHITLDRKGLLVFLRRLYELEEEDGGDVGDAACNLRGGILQTLGIEGPFDEAGGGASEHHRHRQIPNTRYTFQFRREQRVEFDIEGPFDEAEAKRRAEAHLSTIDIDEENTSDDDGELEILEEEEVTVGSTVARAVSSLKEVVGAK